MSRLLALDQASIITGWSVFNNEQLVDYGLIKLNKDECLGKRLVEFRRSIKELIDKYNINEIAFEDIQMQTSIGNNVQTFKVLANIYGIVLELAEELNIKYNIVSSNTWKSTLGIKGKKRSEQKQNAQLYVEQVYHIKVTQDESDSICIGSHIIQNSLGREW